ncbi:hypothetical protein [Paractinoplanes hotanensis]|uniref:Uncharacterized protein n=1 Tax=Paractinoplanes hotanensis TaxID=2906497 RepID=A0ABT0YCV1_9ACTN|nr:hypothetical protein [Actinoplanes hotanensis]MCM4083074.1 hypothetical protein [Actinoplanes hotanensis]
MTTPTPTPEQAQQALDDVGRRQTQTAEAATHSRWAWIASGALLVVWGVLVDQQPQFMRDWGTTIVLMLLALSLLANTRFGGSLLRRPVRPRVPRDARSMVWNGVVIVLMAVGAWLLVRLEVPHATVWAGVAGGLLVAGVGPWWQRRVLARGAMR